MIDLDENDTFSKDESKIEQMLNNLKGKFLDKAIASYKNKCQQYIEQ